MSARVGLVRHADSFRHSAGAGHPERPDRLRAIEARLAEAGIDSRLDVHEPEPAPRAILELVHEPALVDALFDLDAQGGGRIDLDTAMGPGSLDAARRATQGTVDAVHRVLDDSWDAAFVCMRPPGHHATPRGAMGFCLTNHVAAAARWAIAQGGAQRVAVFDWDAHHGNGTQDVFWTDPDVLYVSLHQYPWYPGTGDAAERGAGAGEGRTINVPLPAGTAEDAYLKALDEVVEPALDSFSPDLVLISAGFDAHHQDPLCMMRLTAGAFFRFAQRAARWGRGPVCVLEGGYDLDGLSWSVAATICALLGDDQPAGVPEAELTSMPGTPEATAWVAHAGDLLKSTTT